LLSLHLPEPTNDGENRATLAIRNHWLLASKGWFIGCIPHFLDDDCATQDGREVIRFAIESLLLALGKDSSPLDPWTLNLLGIERIWTAPVERRWLQEIGVAFLDLLDGRIVCDVQSTEVMPGSIPYTRPSLGK